MLIVILIVVLLWIFKPDVLLFLFGLGLALAVLAVAYLVFAAIFGAIVQGLFRVFDFVLGIHRDELGRPV